MTNTMKSRNNENEYQEIKSILQKENINTQDQVNRKIEEIFNAAKRYSLIALIITFALCAILPTYTIFIVLLFGIFVAWLWSSSLSSKHYFQRYLKELSELKSSD